ncbi:hypothetical protein CR513_01948, partial [Mucuna pruriens]
MRTSLPISHMQQTLRTTTSLKLFAVTSELWQDPKERFAQVDVVRAAEMQHELYAFRQVLLALKYN